MADPQGRLHALRRSGLPEGLPVGRRDHSVRQRHRRLPVRALHRLRLLHRRLPVRRAAHEQGRQPGVQVHPVRRPGGRRPGTGLRENLPDRRHSLRHQGSDEAGGGGSRQRAEHPRLPERRSVRSGGGGRHARDVRVAPRRQTTAVPRFAGQPEHQPGGDLLEGRVETLAAIGFAATFAASVFHYVGVGPNRVEDEDEHDESHDEETRK